MSSFPLRRLEKLGHRRSRSDAVVSPDLARAMTEISLEIKRQVGLLLDRPGHVKAVLVGDARGVTLPDLTPYKRGRDRLCGLRLVHTHLNHEPLNEDDMTDLALLRLDTVAAVEVLEDGLPGRVFEAHLLPDNDGGLPWEIMPPVSVHDLTPDFPERIRAIEAEIERVRRPRLAGDTRDRAILVHVGNGNGMAGDNSGDNSLDELTELARSAGLATVHRVVQRRKMPDPRYVMGKGKLQDTLIKAMQLGAEIIIFDMNLTPAQVRSIADVTDLKVLDRTQVILDIFAQHAQTREGKIQVELAQLRYLLPRLGQKHTAMSRLTGGIGGRGPGETKLEINRRRAQDRIAQLSREVEKLGERRKLRRSNRSRQGLPTVAIVGYTNAGKSTLLNALTESAVVAENALFATLNPVSRRLRFPDERDIIITDTVGFIRNLPKDLMAAFRTTFEEAREADLLLHVVDASANDLDEKWPAVREILSRLELHQKPMVVVLNKIDKCDPDRVAGLAQNYGGVPVSALEPKTFGPLLRELHRRLWATQMGAVEQA